MNTDPVKVAGAGLAGLSAALHLARSGYPVVVFEKNDDTGRNRTTDWDAVENWTTEKDFINILADWGVTCDFAIYPSVEMEIYDKDGACYPVTTRSPLFYFTKRGQEKNSIDQALKRQALEAGVEIRYGEPVSPEAVDIWAAGSQNSGYFLGVGMTFRTQASDTVAALVDNLAAPKAYAYLVIVDGLGSLSVLLTRNFQDARAHLNHTIDVFQRLKRFNISDPRITSGFGGVSQAFDQPLTRPIRVGEAAGFQDYLWGFGIRQALHSGHLAGQAVAEGLDYATLAEREIRPLVRSSIVNRFYYDLAGDRMVQQMLRRYATTSDLPQVLRHWYHSPKMGGLLWPLARRVVGQTRE